MKFFLVSLLAAVAVAQPQWLHPSMYHGQYVPGMVSGLAYPNMYTAGLMPVRPIMPVMKADEKKMEDAVKVYSAEKEMEMKQVKPEVYAGNTVVIKEDSADPMKVVEHEPVPFTYNTVYKMHGEPKYFAKNGEVEHKVFKRSADAYNPFVYNSGIFGYKTPYTIGYKTPYNIGYQTPYNFGYQTPYVTGYTHPYQYGTYSNDAVKPEQYAAKGQYAAVTQGSAHFAKRDADADPALVYPTTYGYPYTTGYTTGYTTPFKTAFTGYTTPFQTAFTGYTTPYKTAYTGYPYYSTFGTKYLF